MLTLLFPGVAYMHVRVQNSQRDAMRNITSRKTTTLTCAMEDVM